jgi:predicted XRE-type DNA-binding protein
VAGHTNLKLVENDGAGTRLRCDYTTGDGGVSHKMCAVKRLHEGTKSGYKSCDFKHLLSSRIYVPEWPSAWVEQYSGSHSARNQLYIWFTDNLFLKKGFMNESMVDRLDDQEPLTIAEALEIPQPRAVGSPLPRGNGNRVSVPPTYADLEDRMPMSHHGPVLAPSSSNFAYNGPMLAAPPAVAPVPEAVRRSIGVESQSAAPAVAPVLAAAVPAPQIPAPVVARSVPMHAPLVRPQAQKARSAESPSTLQRAAGLLRHAIPIVQKLLPLLDGNISTAVSNIMSPPAPPAPPAAPPIPARVDLTPLKENIAELQSLHKDLRVRIVEQNKSLKRVEDHLGLVREATDRNTLEQQELIDDLKAMRSKVNVVAAIVIGLLAISLLVNMVLYMHIQRVLP